MTIQEEVEQFEKETFPGYTVPDGDLIVDKEPAAPFRTLLRHVVDECCENAQCIEAYHEGVIRLHFAWLLEAK